MALLYTQYCGLRKKEGKEKWENTTVYIINFEFMFKSCWLILGILESEKERKKENIYAMLSTTYHRKIGFPKPNHCPSKIKLQMYFDKSNHSRPFSKIPILSCGMHHTWPAISCNISLTPLPRLSTWHYTQTRYLSDAPFHWIWFLSIHIVVQTKNGGRIRWVLCLPHVVCV